LQSASQTVCLWYGFLTFRLTFAIVSTWKTVKGCLAELFTKKNMYTIYCFSSRMKPYSIFFNWKWIFSISSLFYLSSNKVLFFRVVSDARCTNTNTIQVDIEMRRLSERNGLWRFFLLIPRVAVDFVEIDIFQDVLQTWSTKSILFNREMMSPIGQRYLNFLSPVNCFYRALSKKITFTHKLQKC
jgi:hypothetical protein